ncbi:hypothetical protein DUNSADRAFT_11063 [Dunaliella salina]|uniref:Uncharacterized protein n=1 Tax=Dunaliella salina TaxID=3046 RepID=A0ABQ7GE50_DUNSA|nr:hypothetical protein DUNSADRAFT_11063 [Dunaliella salina]|eukprot:KAF5832873.1 hypothetical protein DUNSADRAFT_11063 [Dunaliella salina]
MSPRDLNPIYAALGDVKVEHLGTLKNAFHQLEADWCKQLAAGGKRQPRGRRQRAVRSAVHRGRENRSKAGQKPSHAQNDGEVGEAERPHSPNSTALLACSNVDQQHDKEDEQQQQQQQAHPRGRSVGSARQATPGQSTSQAPHADMKRKAPGDGAGAVFRPGPKSQGIVTIGDALRQVSPKPKKKKQRPPWVDNSIPGLPRPFTSDPGPSGFDGQDVASTPADKVAEGGANAAAPATPLAAPHPTSSPASSKHQQPPSPSRIPRHPQPDEAPPSTAGIDHSVSRIPHLTPSDPVQASSSSPRQRKQWGAPVAAQEVASLAAADVPVQPPQLRRGSPIRPVSGASPADPPPPSSTPTSVPPQPQQPGGSLAHPSPISALRASAMENLKEGRHRAMQSRTPMPPNTSLAPVPSRRSLSMEEPPRPGSGDEADSGSALKRSSFNQLPPLLPPSTLEAIPGSPAHASPRRVEPPHSNSQPITEAEAGEAKPAFALGKDVAASVDGAAAALTLEAPAEEAQGAGGQQQGEARKQGYLRKLSALKRTVAPPPGSSPPHSSAGSSQATKQARPHLPPLPEPAPSRQDSGGAQAHQQQQQQQQPLSPSGRLHAAMPRPVSEPAVLEARQEVPPEGRPRRVSDLGSPTKMQQAPDGIEGGPFGWHRQHDSSAGPGGPGSDGAAPSAAAEAPPGGAGRTAGGVAAAGSSRPGRARWQVAPETRQAAWRWEGDASTLARSSSSPFPDAANLAPAPPTQPPHKAPNSPSAQPISVPSNGKSSPQQGSCLLPPAGRPPLTKRSVRLPLPQLRTATPLPP